MSFCLALTRQNKNRRAKAKDSMDILLWNLKLQATLMNNVV